MIYCLFFFFAFNYRIIVAFCLFLFRSFFFHSFFHLLLFNDQYLYYFILLFLVDIFLFSLQVPIWKVIYCALDTPTADRNWQRWNLLVYAASQGYSFLFLPLFRIIILILRLLLENLEGLLLMLCFYSLNEEDKQHQDTLSPFNRKLLELTIVILCFQWT